MTDPVRTALEEAVRGHVAYTSGGATYCDNCHRAWPCAPVFDLMHANSHERAATLALATQPASPECGFFIGWRCDHPEGHEVHRPMSDGTYPEPPFWASHRYGGAPVVMQPAQAIVDSDPESAEAHVWRWVHDDGCNLTTDDHSPGCARRSAVLMEFIQHHRDDAAAAAARATPPLTVEAPREHPGEHHTFSMACDRCGKRGYVNLSVIGPDERLSIEPLAEQGR